MLQRERGLENFPVIDSPALRGCAARPEVQSFPQAFPPCRPSGKDLPVRRGLILLFASLSVLSPFPGIGLAGGDGRTPGSSGLLGTDVSPAGPAVSLEESAPAAEQSLWENLSFDLEAGYKRLIWTPGFRRDILAFETENLQSYSASALFAYKKIPFFIFDHERPVAGTAAQQELIEDEKGRRSGLKKSVFEVDLAPVARIVQPERFLAKLLFSTRVSHTREVYVGETKAVAPFAYVAEGAEIIVVSPGYVLIESAKMKDVSLGESVAFMTEFKDTEVSVGSPSSVYGVPLELRAGYFALKWTRPSDHDRSWHTADDRLILYETRFRSQGALKSLESGSRTGRPPRPRRLPMGIRQRVEQCGEPRRGIRAMGRLDLLHHVRGSRLPPHVSRRPAPRPAPLHRRAAPAAALRHPAQPALRHLRRDRQTHQALRGDRILVLA